MVSAAAPLLPMGFVFMVLPGNSDEGATPPQMDTAVLQPGGKAFIYLFNSKTKIDPD